MWVKVFSRYRAETKGVWTDLATSLWTGAKSKPFLVMMREFVTQTERAVHNHLNMFGWELLKCDVSHIRI